ncbi:hypothetical protein [Spirillospora sp. CA-128828]|uniref:hypothetical protein n=1 Tax=Spirillospora sp. CA-128828 TaxID=3240033 RepID=UPI003D8D033E
MANLLGDGSPGSILKLDRDFGPAEFEWTITLSAQDFENAVTAYAQRFAECSKKHEPEPCEEVR